jgi:hypothetical protein
MSSSDRTTPTISAGRQQQNRSNSARPPAAQLHPGTRNSSGDHRRRPHTQHQQQQPSSSSGGRSGGGRGGGQGTGGGRGGRSSATGRSLVVLPPTVDGRGSNHGMAQNPASRMMPMQQHAAPPPPLTVHTGSGVPFGHVPAYLPGSSSLVEELDKRILIVLRDGKHLIGVSFFFSSLLRAFLASLFAALPGFYYFGLR